MAEKMKISDVPGITRREIEALFIKPFLEAFTKEIGKERTMEIAGEVIDRLAWESGRDYAAQIDGELLPALEKQLLTHNDVGDCNNQLIEKDQKHITVHTTDCEYVRMYQRIGMMDLGYLLSCRRDIAFYKGISSRVQMIRKGTLMQGYDVCDFHIELEK